MVKRSDEHSLPQDGRQMGVDWGLPWDLKGNTSRHRWEMSRWPPQMPCKDVEYLAGTDPSSCLLGLYHWSCMWSFWVRSSSGENWGTSTYMWLLHPLPLASELLAFLLVLYSYCPISPIASLIIFNLFILFCFFEHAILTVQRTAAVGKFC